MKKTIILVILIISISMVLAEYSYEYHNIIDGYQAGEIIKGTFNISFENHPAESQLTSNFPGNITLLELLEANSFRKGTDYNCSTSNCLSDFSARSEINSINLDEEKTIGFQISSPSNSEISSISSVELKIQSDVSPSCFRQIAIDFLDNGELITNTKHSGSVCPLSKNYGCFDTSLSSYTESIIHSRQFCQNISLRIAPAYKVGARIINSTQGSTALKMQILNSDKDVLGECELPQHSIETENLECIIEYSSPKRKEHLVCILAQGVSANNPSDPDYKIRSEASGENCGTSNLDDFNKDYEIYSRPMQFDSVDFTINQDSLADDIEDFINDKYNDKCSPCIIPIGISGQSQTLTFSNSKLRYLEDNNPADATTLFEVEKEPAHLTADILEIAFEPAEFTIPLGSDEDEFKFFINGEKIFSEDILIEESFLFDINPKFIAFGIPTRFSATIRNVSSEWDFGDGSTLNSDDHTAVHTFTKAGTFNLQVTLTKPSGQFSKKTFSITVGNAKDSANHTLVDFQSRIENITGKINTYPVWIQNEIKSEINPDGLRASLSLIREDFNSASSDQEFQDVMIDLIDLDIPFSITQISSGNLPLSLGYSNIDTGLIESISGKQASNPDELEQRIINWIVSKYDPEVEFETITAFRDSGSEEILTRFKIILNLLEEPKESPYFIIGFPPEEINFKTSQGVSVDFGTYIKDPSPEIEFSLPGAVLIEDLAAYISPEIRYLGINTGVKEPRSYPTKTVVIWLTIILVIALIIYIFLQEWYKKNYEKHLFKNPNDLYNLINFVYNSRKSGISDSEIRQKLRKAGWRGETITYTIRKLSGKRTGMFEIPIFKFLENRKVKKELVKRQQRQLDVRFIKRHSL